MSPQPRKSPQQEVLGSLPRTRPQRRSGRRAPAVAEAAQAVEAVVAEAGPAKVKATKAKADKPKANKQAKSAKTKAGASKAKASTEAKSASKVKAGAAGKSTGKVKSKAKAKGPKSARTQGAPDVSARSDAAPVTASAQSAPSAGYAIPDSTPQPPPSGTELVTTAVQAAGELAQIGLSFGGSAVRSALRKLPRP